MAVSRIARAAAHRGWRVLIVGGWVRDRVLGAPSKDVDLEVYGHYSPEALEAFLAQFGEVHAVGRSFGVFKLRTAEGDEIDVAVPRRESKAGKGHKGFIAQPDPTITPRNAAARRDFTFNGLMYDPLKDLILDYFGGVRDLHNRRLRHIGPQFGEDPLRVLRGFQFCGRFGLVAEPQTLEVCRSLKGEYATLSRERIWEEWRKWAVRSVRPSLGLRFLAASGWLNFYPELAVLRGVPQDPQWHPEGDVWEHTLATVDAAAAICQRDGLSGDHRAVIVFAALLHDAGKPAVTQRIGGRWRAPGHPEAGVEPAAAFLERIGAPSWLREAVSPLVREHMAHVSGAPTPRAVRRLAARLEPACVQDWGRVVEADHAGRPPLPGGLPERAAAMLRLAALQGVLAEKPRPILMGRHLRALGMEPGPQIGALLREAYQAQLDGAFSSLEEALLWVERRRP